MLVEIILLDLTHPLFFTGYWNIIVYGRKHSYRLYTKMLNEAMRWTAAIQGVIDSKTPIETPTLQLIRDIKVRRSHRQSKFKFISRCVSLRWFFYTIVSSQENSVNPEIVEQMYRRNPILRYTQHPLHAPLLPLPYGEVTSCEWNRETSYAPNFLFHRKLKRPKKPTQKSVKWSKSSVIGWKTGYTQEGSPADHRTNIELDKDKLTDPQPELV